MRTFIVALIVVLWLAAVATAASPSQECLQVLEKNFAAINGEDTKALMGTIAPSCPRDAAVTFYNEAVAMFEETDVHVSLGDYQFLGVELPFAAARVVQYTYVSEGGEPTEYRQASNLLPAAEAVTYIQIFRKERGKWYIWRSQEEAAIDMPAGLQRTPGRCRNGRCQPAAMIRLD